MGSGGRTQTNPIHAGDVEHNGPKLNQSVAGIPGIVNKVAFVDDDGGDNFAEGSTVGHIAARGGQVSALHAPRSLSAANVLRCIDNLPN